MPALVSCSAVHWCCHRLLAIVGSVVILKFVDVTIGLRVTEDEEIQGLDLSQHGEEGYAFDVTA
jgi:Amt family ammonium transporter